MSCEKVDCCRGGTGCRWVSLRVLGWAWVRFQCPAPAWDSFVLPTQARRSEAPVQRSLCWCEH